jgi:hypothetical protein
MYTNIKKPKENKGRAFANSVTQKKGYGKQDAVIEPNRSESAIQLQTAQLIKIGKTQVKNVTELSGKLNQGKEKIITDINNALSNFKAVDEAEINDFLNRHTKRVKHVSTSEYEAFIQRLAILYKRFFFSIKESEFYTKIEKIENDDDYKDLMDPEKHDYGGVVGGEDDATVGDIYNQSLACSLYALLTVRPNFMGAKTPKALHNIFRAKEVTREYDEEKEIAKIRLSAGLTYSTDYKGKSVNQMIQSFNTTTDRNRRIIVDPAGNVAHTFALKYDNGWKKFDNDNPNGTSNLGTNSIAFTWE